MDAKMSIRADGLKKRYGAETAVSGIDLRIPPGTVYGFLGPNGAGKTTTMRILTTLLRPTSGVAHVAGHSVENRDEVIPHIGYVPERPPLHEELTGREQLSYVADLRDVPEAMAAERIAAHLDRFDLSDSADERIESYSKGMKQKVSLIQAIVHEPDVLFLDEPSSGLDPRAARRVREVITELASDETTIFLSTHILSVVDELADEIGLLFDGELVAEGAPDVLKRRAEGGDSTLEDVFIDATSRPGPKAELIDIKSREA